MNAIRLNRVKGSVKDGKIIVGKWEVAEWNQKQAAVKVLSENRPIALIEGSRL